MVKNAKNWVNPASAFRALTHLSERLVLFVQQISDPIFTISSFISYSSKKVVILTETKHEYVKWNE